MLKEKILLQSKYARRSYCRECDSGYSSMCYLCPSATWLFVLMTVSTANGERGDHPPSYCALYSQRHFTADLEKNFNQMLMGSKEV